MNCAASVFHFHGQVRVADRGPDARTGAARTLHIVRKALQPNPWGVTPRQAQVLDVMLRCKSQKEAAKELGAAPKTIEAVIQRAKKNMGATGNYQHLLLWQEFRLRERRGEGGVGASDETCKVQPDANRGNGSADRAA